MGKIIQTAGRNALGEFAPEFAHFNDDVLFGENWNNQDIDVKTRSIITVVGFIFTLLIIATAYCYHDWVQVAFLFALSVILYLILFAGVFVDTVLDMTRERIIDFIIS